MTEMDDILKKMRSFAILICLGIFGEQVISKSIPPINRILINFQNEVKSLIQKEKSYTTTDYPWTETSTQSTTERWDWTTTQRPTTTWKTTITRDPTTTWEPTVTWRPTTPQESNSTSSEAPTTKPEPKHQIKVEVKDIDLKIGEINVDISK